MSRRWYVDERGMMAANLVYMSPDMNIPESSPRRILAGRPHSRHVLSGHAAQEPLRVPLWVPLWGLIQAQVEDTRAILEHRRRLDAADAIPGLPGRGLVQEVDRARRERGAVDAEVRGPELRRLGQRVVSRALPVHEQPAAHPGDGNGP